MLTSLRRTLRLCFDRLFWRSMVDVRLLGKEADWWVCTRLLLPGSCVLSGGAGNDVSFELELARLGCNVALFDPSPTGQATMAKPGNRHPKLQFIAQGLAARDTTIRFAPPVIPA